MFATFGECMGDLEVYGVIGEESVHQGLNRIGVYQTLQSLPGEGHVGSL